MGREGGDRGLMAREDEIGLGAMNARRETDGDVFSCDARL